jgi:uncharacterized membrane protein
MDKKVTGILAYITIIGWVIAYVAGDKEGAKFHLNQGLVVGVIGLIIGLVGRIPIWFFMIISSLLSIALLIFVILGIIYAAQDQDKELPFIGSIKLLK